MVRDASSGAFGNTPRAVHRSPDYVSHRVSVVVRVLVLGFAMSGWGCVSQGEEAPSTGFGGGTEANDRRAQGGGSGGVQPRVLPEQERQIRELFRLEDSLLEDAEDQGWNLLQLAESAAQRSPLLEDFVRKWLLPEESSSIVRAPPDGPADLFTLFDEETIGFFRWVVSNNGGLKALLTTRYPGRDPDLEAFYGASEGTAFGGILTQGSFLRRSAGGFGDSNAPVRGHQIWKLLLCREPLGMTRVPLPEPPRDTRTRRAFFEQYTAHARCKACHKQLNTLGWPLEGFDGLGRPQREQNGTPVDTRAELGDVLDVSAQVDGPVELGTALAGLEVVQDCVFTRVSQFISPGREAKGGDDINAMTPLARYFAIVAVSMLGEETAGDR